MSRDEINKLADLACELTNALAQSREDNRRLAEIIIRQTEEMNRLRQRIEELTVRRRAACPF